MDTFAGFGNKPNRRHLEFPIQPMYTSHVLTSTLNLRGKGSVESCAAPKGVMQASDIGRILSGIAKEFSVYLSDVWTPLFKRTLASPAQCEQEVCFVCRAFAFPLWILGLKTAPIAFARSPFFCRCHPAAEFGVSSLTFFAAKTEHECTMKLARQVSRKVPSIHKVNGQGSEACAVAVKERRRHPKFGNQISRMSLASLSERRVANKLDFRSTAKVTARLFSARSSIMDSASQSKILGGGFCKR